MLKFKSCPKCRGDLIQDINEFHEMEEACLQCGHRAYPKSQAHSALADSVGVWHRKQKVKAA